MNIQHQSYSTSIFRPSPNIFQEDDLVLIVTPWGNKDISEDFAQAFSEALVGQPSDETIVATRVEEMPTEESKIKKALELANNSILAEFNKQEWSCGVEVAVLKQQDNKVFFVGVGHPGIYLKRSKRNLQPVAVNSDLSMQLTGNQQNSVLPSQLLGTQDKPELVTSNFELSTSDQVLLVSRTQVPGSLFATKQAELKLEDCTRKLVKDDEDIPFWIALINF